MRNNTTILSTLIAAAFVSGAFVSNAVAENPNQAVGDLNGNVPVSVERMKIQNEKALRAARNVRRIEPLGYDALATSADFPDQAFGDLSGDVPVPVRTLAKDRDNTGQRR